jgi:hypothetical protein
MVIGLILVLSLPWPQFIVWHLCSPLVAEWAQLPFVISLILSGIAQMVAGVLVFER